MWLENRCESFVGEWNRLHQRRRRMWPLGIVVVLLLGGWACGSEDPTGPIPEPGRVKRVPADYPTIQAALDAAEGEDSVLVAPGHYYGSGNTRLRFHGRWVSLIAESGPESTFIECRDTLGAAPVALYPQDGETSATEVQGFTIRRSGWKYDRSPLVLCEQSGPTFRNCRFVGDGSTLLRISHAGPSFRDCTISGERLDIGGGLIEIYEGTPRFLGTTISENYGARGSVLRCEKSYLELMHCQITGNGGAGVVRLINSAGTLEYCLIAKNATVEGYTGGISVEGRSSFGIGGCTIADNFSYTGAGITVVGGASVFLGRCILWGNCAEMHAAVRVEPWSHASLQDCAVDTSQVGGPGTVVYRGGIREDDPRFCRPAGCLSGETGDYRVRDDSPYRYSPY